MVSLAVHSGIRSLVSDARQALCEFIGSLDSHDGAATTSTRVDQRVLLPRLLLHVYRLPADTLSRPINWRPELNSVLSSAFWKRFSRTSKLTTPRGDLQSVHMTAVATDVARRVHEDLHYLGSFHDGIHVGLGQAGKRCPLSLVSLSGLDVVHLQRILPPGVTPSEVLVLSRLFAAQDAPANTLSFTMGQAFTWVRQHSPQTRLLLTYLDPNLGFAGTVYRATNWFPVAREPRSAYLYLDGEYTSSRELLRRFGSYDWSQLSAAEGIRISRSSVALEPLEVFGYWIDTKRERRVGRSHLG